MVLIVRFPISLHKIKTETNNNLMASNNWKFNPMTGTMEPVTPMAHSLNKKVEDDGVQKKTGAASIPVIKSGKSLIKDIPSDKPNVSVKERDVVFREKSDLSIVQIIDYDTNRIMGYIAGYGLDINFNMEELSSVDKVEQFLEGLKKAFRSVILEKALAPK